MSVVCCHLKVSASGWSLVQMSPTECVSEFDREGWTKEEALAHLLLSHHIKKIVL